MAIDKYELNRLNYGDRVKTTSGFIITFDETVSFVEEKDKLFVSVVKRKSYGNFELYEEIVALYKRTCKIKRKK